MRAVGILLCAGSARRMGFDKLTRPLAGRTAIERSMEALLAGGAARLVIAAGDETRAYIEGLRLPPGTRVVPGGATRTESVRSALDAAEGEVAAIHDAARCFVEPALVRRCIESAAAFGSGVAAVRATDTAFLEEGEALRLVPREGLWLMQTPQAFRLADIRAAYARRDIAATDDATLFLAAGHRLRFVESTADNFKLTGPADWALAQRLTTRYGTGFDTHRLTGGRRLVLGGVEIPFEKGLL
ncbi:MAG: 2-C-methyl-D-erythritol 4-phosphate cytidylyltransferase, partial [Clostridia bacterium]|nr:2-C-methyl-D-erythritol 4-phosphate cytidylyltransferase [Clostridia bacterium]